MAGRGRRGRARSLGWLAVWLVVAEAAAFGAWAAMKAAGIGEEPWMLGGYGAAAGLLVIIPWGMRSRTPRRPAEVVRQREHQDGETRAALLRLDRMDPVRLGEHVAVLCRRDGLADVEAVRVHGDAHSVDVTGSLSGGGAAVTVRCRSAAGSATVSGSVVERFTDAEQHAGHTLVLVTTAGTFSAKARDLAAEDGGPLLLDRRALARWDLAAELPEPLRRAAAGEKDEPARAKRDTKRKRAAADAP